MTEQTVKFHLSNTYRKLGVANRTEATHYAYLHAFVAERDGDAAGRLTAPRAASERRSPILIQAPDPTCRSIATCPSSDPSVAP